MHIDIRYFDTFGDKSPTCEDEIKVSVSMKKDVWETYMRQLEKSDKKVSLPRFYELWDSLYPLSINRPWVNIPGKCSICYYIDQMRRKSTSVSVQKALQQAHLLHRGGLFMLERREYKNRVVEALMDDSNNPTIMSIVIDGMDNNKCRCPYKGTQDSFSGAIPQHIIGVKEHGRGSRSFGRSVL